MMCIVPAMLIEAPAQSLSNCRASAAGWLRRLRSEAHRRRWDRHALAACAVAVLVTGVLSPPHTAQRIWGLLAAAGYGCAALAAHRSRRAWARGPALIAVAGAFVVPLLWLTLLGTAQMEVGVVERAARLLLSTGSPYHVHPHAVADFNPYLPGMALLGLPHALLGHFGYGQLTGARASFVLVFLAAVAGSARMIARGGGVAGDAARVRGSASGQPAGPAGAAGATGALRAANVTGVLWLIACPLVALPLAIGGVDPPVIGLLCLALAGTHRGLPLRSGLALGAASALKWTAWPAIPVLVIVFAVRRGKRAAYACGGSALGIAVLSVLPALLADGTALYRNVVLYPLGLAHTASSAQSPLLGHLIVELLPHGKAVAVALIALSALAVGVSLLVRPPRNVVAAGDRLAFGLLLAILLLPATRAGYAVYPVALRVWPRLAVARRRPTGARSHAVGAPTPAPTPVPVADGRPSARPAGEAAPAGEPAAVRG